MLMINFSANCTAQQVRTSGRCAAKIPRSNDAGSTQARSATTLMNDANNDRAPRSLRRRASLAMANRVHQLARALCRPSERAGSPFASEGTYFLFLALCIGLGPVVAQAANRVNSRKWSREAKRAGAKWRARVGWATSGGIVCLPSPSRSPFLIYCFEKINIWHELVSSRIAALTRRPLSGAQLARSPMSGQSRPGRVGQTHVSVVKGNKWGIPV